jgi:hypothetical protein
MGDVRAAMWLGLVVLVCAALFILIIVLIAQTL